VHDETALISIFIPYLLALLALVWIYSSSGSSSKSRSWLSPISDSSSNLPQALTLAPAAASFGSLSQSNRSLAMALGPNSEPIQLLPCSPDPQFHVPWQKFPALVLPIEGRPEGQG
jgi:hypothetical protein